MSELSIPFFLMSFQPEVRTALTTWIYKSTEHNIILGVITVL